MLKSKGNRAEFRAVPASVHAWAVVAAAAAAAAAPGVCSAGEADWPSLPERAGYPSSYCSNSNQTAAAAAARGPIHWPVRPFAEEQAVPAAEAAAVFLHDMNALYSIDELEWSPVQIDEHIK